MPGWRIAYPLAALAAANAVYALLVFTRAAPGLELLAYSLVFLAAGLAARPKLYEEGLGATTLAALPWIIVYTGYSLVAGFAVNIVSSTPPRLLYSLASLAALLAGRDAIRERMREEGAGFTTLYAYGVAAFNPLLVYPLLLEDRAVYQLLVLLGLPAAAEVPATLLLSQGYGLVPVLAYGLAAYAPLWFPVAPLATRTGIVLLAATASLLSLNTLLPRDQRIAWPLLLGVLATLWLVAASHGIGGVLTVIVATGSMRPAIQPGDIVVINTVWPITRVKEGDIIAFVHKGRLVVHRVYRVLVPGVVETKGDANPTPDEQPVTMDNYVGRVVAVIPRVGIVLDTIKRLPAMLAAGAAIATIAALATVGAVRTSREKHDKT